MTAENSEPIAPVLAGRFALYETPKGGLHLSLLVDGETEPRHIEVPAMMLRMMRANPFMKAHAESVMPDAVE